MSSPGRIAGAFRLYARELRRRPLVIALVVFLPFFFISRAIAATEATPRTLTLPGRVIAETTMRGAHGAMMAAITIAFISGLAGASIARSSLQSDQRLVVSGFTVKEALVPRFLSLAAIAATATTVSMGVTALSFEPQSWPAFIAGNVLIAAIYGLIGVLAGAIFGQLGATYFVLFLAMLGMGILQNPMFGDGDPHGLAFFMPDYGAARVVIDGAFGDGFSAWGAGATAFAWVASLSFAVMLTLGRSLGLRNISARPTRSFQFENRQ
ncbi:MAG: hypothetical protein ACSLFF_03350 [Solirubrobacterales bacterium]